MPRNTPISNSMRSFCGTCWSTFQTLPRPWRAIARILKPGGLLWVAVPNLASWQAAWTHYAWFHLDFPRHCWHFRADRLQERLKSLGFEIVHTGYASLDQNIYGWIQSVLNACGLPYNLLYDLIRRDSARRVDRPLVTHPLASWRASLGWPYSCRRHY